MGETRGKQVYEEKIRGLMSVCPQKQTSHVTSFCLEVDSHSTVPRMLEVRCRWRLHSALAPWCASSTLASRHSPAYLSGSKPGKPRGDAGHHAISVYETSPRFLIVAKGTTLRIYLLITQTALTVELNQQETGKKSHVSTFLLTLEDGDRGSRFQRWLRARHSWWL